MHTHRFVKTKVKRLHCWLGFRELSSETDNLNMFNYTILLQKKQLFLKAQMSTNGISLPCSTTSMSLIMINSRSYKIFLYMESELKTPFEPPANKTPKECMRLETAFTQLCTMDHQFSSWNNFLLSLGKQTFWAGILKWLFGQLLARCMIYLTRENRYWAQLTLQTQHMSNKTSETSYFVP